MLFSLLYTNQLTLKPSLSSRSIPGPPLDLRSSQQMGSGIRPIHLPTRFHVHREYERLSGPS